MWTAKKIAQKLEVSDETVLRLTDARLLVVEAKIGTAYIYDDESVKRLMEAKGRPLDTDHSMPPGLIVRLGAPDVENEGKPDERQIGFAADWDDEKIVEEAARQWWRIARPDEQIGRALVALVGPVTTRVWNITDWEFNPELGRTAFEIEAPTDAQRAAYEWKWIELKGQNPVRYWPPKAV